MPLYKVSVKQRKINGPIRLEPGMSVEVVTNMTGNPIFNAKAEVRQAFLRIYGIDIEAAGALNTVYLSADRIS